MKKKVLLFTATLGLGALVLSSYDDGPAHAANLNRTGAPGTTASCGGGGCHAAGSTATTISGIVLTDVATGTQVTNGEYQPGHTYTGTLTGANSSLLPKFGFQMCVENSSNANTGTLTAATGSTNTYTKALTGITILEHSTPIAGTSGAYTVPFKWVAPAAGTGTVTFYSMLNAVNGDDQESGDAPAASGNTTAFTEAAPTAIGNTAIAVLKSYPNPATDALHLQLAKEGSYTATITDAAGKTMFSQQLQASGSQSESTISVATLASGVYQLSLSNGGAQQVIRFVKK